MKRFILPVLLLIAAVSFAFAQSDGATPDQVKNVVNTIGVISAIVLGVISIPVTNFLKEKIPFMAGWLVPLLSGVVNLALLYGLNLFLGWGVWQDPSFFQQCVAALGINQTMASIVYEATKPKTV